MRLTEKNELGKRAWCLDTWYEKAVWCVGIFYLAFIAIYIFSEIVLFMLTDY